VKQQIVCTACEDRLRKAYPNGCPYPDEDVKLRPGRALKLYICDLCSARIGVLEKCCAFSMWSTIAGQPYYEWEQEYLIIKKNA